MSKGTRFSQVVSASAVCMYDLMKFIQSDSDADLARLKKSVADYRRVLEEFKQHPIHD